MDLREMISRLKVEEIQDVLQALVERYRQLYPDWDINIISLEKKRSRNDQLDEMITLLESMKE